jgi:hypothetical protein
MAGFEDQQVPFTVKVRWFDQAGYLVDGLTVNQQRTNYRFLGINIVGR